MGLRIKLIKKKIKDSVMLIQFPFLKCTLTDYILTPDGFKGAI